MSAKGLIVLGLAWLVIVVLVLTFTAGSWGYAWPAQSSAKRAVIIAGIYLFGFLYQAFVIGWIVPIILGTYRLARHR